MTDQERAEFEALQKRMTRLETLIVGVVLKLRETAIIEMSYIEDALNMPRTKEKKRRE